jgi:RNase H-like domain found in reverse transcriptase
MQRLVDGPILIIPDLQGEFIVTTDASGTGTDAVLQQEYQGKLRAVAFYSRLLSDAERNCATHEKAALAICQAFKVWRPYLHNRKVTVFHRLSAIKIYTNPATFDCETATMGRVS